MIQDCDPTGIGGQYSDAQNGGDTHDRLVTAGHWSRRLASISPVRGRRLLVDLIRVTLDHESDRPSEGFDPTVQWHRIGITGAIADREPGTVWPR